MSRNTNECNTTWQWEKLDMTEKSPDSVSKEQQCISYKIYIDAFSRGLCYTNTFYTGLK